MLKPNKVKLMTKIAIEDKKYSLVNNKATGTSSADYVFMSCFKSFIAYSICFMIIAMSIVMIGFEKFTQMIFKYDITDLLWVAIGIYIIGLIVYMIIIIFISLNKYAKDRNNIIKNNKRIAILKQNFYDER